MYQFTVSNEVVGYAVTPTYIKKLDNGCYGLCSQAEAEGVAVRSTPYRLEGKELDNLPVVNVEEVDDGTFFESVLTTNQANATYVESLNTLGVQTEEVTNDAE